MYNDETVYRIDLEDYAYPRFAGRVKAYFGTKEEIMELMSSLSANAHSAMRYAQTIEAVDRYDLDSEMTHVVAGQERPVLTPVQVLIDKTQCYENTQWLHNGCSGAKIAAKAERLEVRQLLLRCGDQVIRCGKFRFQGLHVCMPGFGWVQPGKNLRGFPGVMEYCEPDLHRSTLFSEMEVYEEDKMLQGIVDTKRLREWDYEILCDDILGEV